MKNKGEPWALLVNKKYAHHLPSYFLKWVILILEVQFSKPELWVEH